MGMWENRFIMGIRPDCGRSWGGSETRPALAFQKNWCSGQVPPAGKSGKRAPTWVDRLEPGSEAGRVAYGQLFLWLVVWESLVVSRLAGRKEREKARTSSLPSLIMAAARTLEGDAHCSISTLQIEGTSLFLRTPTWDPAVKQPDWHSPTPTQAQIQGACLNECLCWLLSLGITLATFNHVVCSKSYSFSFLHNMELYNYPIIYLCNQLWKGI